MPPPDLASISFHRQLTWPKRHHWTLAQSQMQPFSFPFGPRHHRIVDQSNALWHKRCYWSWLRPISGWSTNDQPLHKNSNYENWKRREVLCQIVTTVACGVNPLSDATSVPVSLPAHRPIAPHLWWTPQRMVSFATLQRSQWPLGTFPP